MFDSHTCHGEEGECVTCLVYLVTQKKKEAHQKVCVWLCVCFVMRFVKGNSFSLITDVHCGAVD